MIIRLPEGSSPQKFSGRSLTLRPGDNEIGKPDRKLLVLLRRGESRGLWEIDPPAKGGPPAATSEPAPTEPGSPVDAQVPELASDERASKFTRRRRK